MTWNTSFQPLLAYKASFEKSADSLMGIPLQVTVSFSLVASKILSLLLILGNLMMMCLGVFLLGSHSLELSELPGLPGSLFPSPHQGSFPSLFVQISFHFLLFLFSFWHPYDSDVIMFKVVLEVPKALPIFLNSSYFILFWLNVDFFFFF